MYLDKTFGRVMQTIIIFNTFYIGLWLAKKNYVYHHATLKGDKQKLNECEVMDRR